MTLAAPDGDGGGKGSDRKPRDPTAADDELKKALTGSKEASPARKSTSRKPAPPALPPLPRFTLRARVIAANGKAAALVAVGDGRQPVVLRLRVGDRLALPTARGQRGTRPVQVEVKSIDTEEVRLLVRPHDVEVIVR